MTLVGTIAPAPAQTLAARMQELETWYGSVPDQGDLVKTVDGESITYPDACLEIFRALKKPITGVAYGYELTSSWDNPRLARPQAQDSSARNRAA